MPAPVSPSAHGAERAASATRLWDEAARPSRQQDAGRPSGPARAGPNASAELVGVHDMLRQELAAIRDVIAQVRAGAVAADRARSHISQMTMRQNNWTMGAYCQSYCRIVSQHHSLEDVAVFPHLQARDPALGPVLDRLQYEHVVIHGVLDSIDQALVEYIARPGDTSALQEVVDQLSDALLSHLAYEERELIEPLSRHGFYDLRT
jgi:hemerythrin-like domain-containing protein